MAKMQSYTLQDKMQYCTSEVYYS